MPLVEYWKLVVLERYAKFDGRASRAEYWWFFLANLIVVVAIYILIAISSIFFILLLGFWLALIVPSIAVAIRRLHDTNKTGWFLLIGLIPFGGIVVLIFLATQGNLTANEYGEPEPGLALAA
jgi:uncharacterized membrane protein YhaH (DUF805 family)